MALPPPLAALLSYRDDLRDAETLQQVTEDTSLVALHKLSRSAHSDLLRNLAWTARPPKQCWLVLDEDIIGQSPAYNVHVTFSRLLMAPAIRLEFSFNGLPRDHSLKFALEHPLRSANLQLIKHDDRGMSGDEFIFQASPGRWSSEGLDRVVAKLALTGEPGQHLVSRVRQLLHDPSLHAIRLLNLEPISTDTTSCLPGILPYIIGPQRLPSLKLPEWSTYWPLSWEQKPRQLIDAAAPHPMISFQCGEVVHSIRQLQVELFESARILAIEQELAVKKWASVTHTGTPYKVGRMIVVAVRFTDYPQLAGSVQTRVPERMRTKMICRLRARQRYTSTPPPHLGNVGATSILTRVVDKTDRDKALVAAELAVRRPGFYWKNKLQAIALLPVLPDEQDHDLHSHFITEGETMPAKIDDQFEVSSEHEFSCNALRSAVPLDLPTSYDALFIITKGANARLRDACYEVDAAHIGPGSEIKFIPAVNTFTLKSQYATACALENPSVERWWQLLLNQDLRHQRVDLVTARVTGSLPINLKQVHAEWDRVLRWKSWNAEQRQAIESIRQTSGGVALITGPAGTGKTLVQQAICAVLWRLGLHVLVLAPANSNCNDFVSKMAKSCPDVDGLRVFAASTDVDLKHAIPEDLPTPPPTPTDEDQVSGSNVFDFELLREELSASTDPDTKAREYGVQAQIFKAARAGAIKLFRKLRDSTGREVGGIIDFWQKLRDCIHACAAGTFDWDDESAVDMYEQVYQTCKGHIIGRSRLIVTTTGNVSSAAIQDHWAQDRYGWRSNGVVIILDEACKDREVDTLAALMLPGFRNKVTGMIMVGDERQLEPTNTSAKGDVQFNPFSDRLSIPLLSRLKNQGFGCVELVEQHRMSHHIARWPFENFYPPGMRSSACTRITLRDRLPGLHACLFKICEKHLPCSFCLYTPAQQDLYLRTKYVQVDGRRDNSTGSAFVREHVVAFFNNIFWHLRAYFGEKTSENVMVICAYKGAIRGWEEASKHLQRKHKLPKAQMPRIATIDSSQGTEAPVTFIDCSVQQYKWQSKRADIGFIDDDKRMNVCMTRAQEVRWFLGGNCSIVGVPGRRMYEDPAYVRHRAQLSNSDALWVLGNKKLASDESSWLDMLEKKDVSLGIKYVQDLARVYGH